VGEIEVSAGDFDDLDALYAELRGVQGIVVTAVPAPVMRGDQGALVDVLMVACTSGAITADDAEEGLAALKEILDGP